MEHRQGDNMSQEKDKKTEPKPEPEVEITVEPINREKIEQLKHDINNLTTLIHLQRES